MSDATETARRRKGQAEEKAQNGRRKEAPDVGDVTESAQGATDTVREGVGGQTQTLTSELKGAIRDAAIEVLKPVATQVTTQAAKTAVSKGPDLVKDKVLPKVSEAGGAGALAKGALSKGGDVAGGITEKFGRKGGGKTPTGHGRGRRLPVQEWVDVAVDLETAYDQWTQFEEFPKFMHRVEKIEQRDDTTLMWHENIWGVRRSWEAEILEQTPCERIVWRSKGGPQTVGVVTFHRLSDRLTRVQVNLDFQPQGFFEKTASGFRMSRRALRSDLMRFKAFIEMKDEPTGAWRGRIEEGELVEGEEDQDEARGREDEEEARGREDEEETYAREDEEEPDEEERGEEDEEDEEPTAEADEDESEDEDEEYEEERPAKKSVRRRRPAGRRPASSRRR